MKISNKIKQNSFLFSRINYRLIVFHHASNRGSAVKILHTTSAIHWHIHASHLMYVWVFLYIFHAKLHWCCQLLFIWFRHLHIQLNIDRSYSYRPAIPEWSLLFRLIQFTRFVSLIFFQHFKPIFTQKYENRCIFSVQLQNNAGKCVYVFVCVIFENKYQMITSNSTMREWNLL